MKITVFGGGGFIGSSICDRLLKDNNELVIFERPRVVPYRNFKTDEHVSWVVGDFMSIHDVTSAIDGVDVILHLISTTLPKNSNEDPIFDVQTNLVATIQLLQAMVKKNVKKIIFISSGGTVYGNPLYTPLDEEHPTNPMVSYGITKLTIEKYLLFYQHHYGIKSIILRVANPYGERQRVETAQGALTNFIYKALNYQLIEIWGDGSVTRDYIYISDLTDAFLKAIYYNGDKTVFNIGSGKGTSLNELINLIGCTLNREIQVNYRPSRPFDVPINILNNQLAHTELGWQAKLDIDAGIKKTICLMQKNL